MSRGQNKLRKHLGKIAAITNNRCHLCGEGFAQLIAPEIFPDSKSAQWWKVMRPTLDHIIPESYGGTYERKNIRLAHNKCNSTRGNKPLLYFKMFVLFKKIHPFFAIEIPTSQWFKIQKINSKKSYREHKLPLK